MTSTGFAQQGSVGTAGPTTAWRSIELDESQRQVIDTPDGVSAAVFGAPGSGKTALAVEIVADRVLERGYDPSHLLVIAPHRRAATALRDILALRIERPTEGPLARTLNSVAFQIVRAAAARRGDELPRLLTGAEQDAIIAELLRGHDAEGGGPAWPDGLDGDVRALGVFRTELRELMMRATEHSIAPGQLADIGRRSEHPEWVAAAQFITEYGQVVDNFDGRYLDSAELLAEAARVVRAGEGLDGLRTVIIDDFHELTPGALAFLRALAQRGVAVIALGDPDVTTSTFRGADPGALAALSLHLGVDVQTHVLSRVYRHGDSLRSLVREITGRIGVSGVAKQREAAASDSAPGHGDDSPTILRVEAPSNSSQFERIARVLREHHVFRDIPWSRMAVIVRSGASIEPLSRALSTAEVPTTPTTRGRSLAAEYASRQLILAAALAVERLMPDPDLVTQLLTGPLAGLDSLGLRRVRLALRHQELAQGGVRSADELLRDELSVPGGFAGIDSAAGRTAARFAQTLHRARELAAEGASAEEILWLFWEKSGLAETWSTQALGTGISADEANRHLDSVLALFTSAKRFVERFPTEPAIRFIGEALDSEVPEDSLTPRAAADTVWVGTPNGAVGLDFDIVVLANLNDGVWPHLRLRGAMLNPQRLSAVVAGLPVADLDERASLLSDELRMLALAVSRTTRHLIVAATVNDDEQPSPFLRFPSLRSAPLSLEQAFPLSLRGLVGGLRRRLVEHDDAAAASALARLAAENVQGAHPDDWYGLREPSTSAPLVDLTVPENTVSVSPSQLETFEKSPLVWFVNTFAASPSGLAAGIGTLVHSAMEHASEVPGGADPISVDALWESIGDKWAQLRFDAPWVADREKRAVTVLLQGLSSYLRDAERGGRIVIGSELRFEIALGQVVLRGSIDRVERASDGSIEIVDLKTGRTAPSKREAVDHAQLAAYQFAVVRGAAGTDEAPGESGEAGEIGAHEGETPVIRGASLLFVGKPTKKVDYTLITQPPKSDDEHTLFAARVHDVGVGMAGAIFWGSTTLDEHDPASSSTYRIHVVAAVSA